jgi:hypothetical protein
VLVAGAGLKQLQLSSCRLLEGSEGVAAALAALPGLQHLIFSSNRQGFGYCISRDAPFPSSVLPQLQQLTYLEIVGQCDDPAGLQQLQGLTRLLGLRLGLESCVFETSTLLGMTQLQRLELAGGFALGAQLLSHLKPLQQLTFLSLPNSYGYLGPRTPPAASFSALTASTKLQVLDISSSTLAPGSWQPCALLPWPGVTADGSLAVQCRAAGPTDGPEQFDLSEPVVPG